MRVLFTTFAAKSHMHAQVPLAWALCTAGHNVCVASQPDLAKDITCTGLTAVPVGEALNLEDRMQEVDEGLDGADQMESQAKVGMDMSEIRPEKLTWDYVNGVFSVMTAMVFQNTCSESMIDDLVEFSREWRPDLVIWDTMTFGGAVAARVCGAAHARLLFGLDLIGRVRATFNELLRQRPAQLRDDPIREWLSWTLDRYCCDFDESAVVGQWTIDPVPPSIRFPVDLHYVPFSYVPYNGPSIVPEWLRARPNRRRVCLTLGVAHREVLGSDRASIGELLDAVADIDVEVVATLNEKQLGSIKKLPNNVRAVDFVPLNALLPTCSAIIHHGGSGTFQNALLHGVPQIIVPDMVWDTIHKAYALVSKGAGLYSDVNRFDPDELRSHLIRVLDEPSFERNAKQIRAEMLGTPSPNDIVPVLERLTAEHRA